MSRIRENTKMFSHILRQMMPSWLPTWTHRTDTLVG